MSHARLAALLVCFATAGCTSLRTVQPTHFIPKEQPDRVWITRTDGKLVTVDDPKLSGDTLLGTQGMEWEPVAIDLKEIHKARALTTDPVKTALFIGLPIATIVSFWVYEVTKPGSDRALKAPSCGFDEDGFPYPYC